MWEKGESGNPKGRGLYKPFQDAIERAIAQSDGKKLRDCAEKLLACAAAGEPWAMEMLSDKLDGKAPQKINVAHSVEPVSETDSWIRDALGIQAEGEISKPMPH